MTSIGPDHYRYVDGISPEGLVVRCETFKVIGETDKCWYIADQYVLGLMSGHQWPWVADAVKKHRRRVLKETNGYCRRYAYPDRDHALRSYKLRKSKQLDHAELSLERARAALGYFGDVSVLSSAPDGDKLVIPNEHIQGLGWGGC